MPGSPTVERNLNDILARAKGISTKEGAQEFVDVVSGILDSDNSDKELDVNLKSKALSDLRKACGRYGLVPTSYVLTGVVKDNHIPQKTGITTETWRGDYKSKPVAIKMFKVTGSIGGRDKIKARFCKEAVLWKRLTHKNILPFLGVSKDTGEFCLISPWMNNGTIMEYICGGHQINRLELLKDVANGLNFLHSKNLVHGDLRAEHILIGGDGQVCIANTGHSRIVSITFAFSKTLIESGSNALNEFKWRWAAPELQQPDVYGMQKVIVTKASDIYGMGMVVYEVLTREAPFNGYTDSVVLAKIQSGKRPRRPANITPSGITDPIWMLLEQCWDWEPNCRPNSGHVLNIIREACRFGDTRAAIPRQLKLKMKDIVTNWETQRNINAYVTLQYGRLTYKTSRATAAKGNKYVWDEDESWSICLEKQHTHQVVTVLLFHRSHIPFKRKKLLGVGKLALSTATVDLSAEIDEKLVKGLSGARVNVQLMVM